MLVRLVVVLVVVLVVLLLVLVKVMLVKFVVVVVHQHHGVERTTRRSGARTRLCVPAWRRDTAGLSDRLTISEDGTLELTIAKAEHLN